MGAVYAAYDTLLHREIALKVMRPELTASPTARERFLREARAAAGVESDYIVPIHQVGEDNGVLFIAMPLLKGETLDDRLKRDGKLSVPTAFKVAREVAEALRAAHDAGLVHRDIKPANLWLEGGAADRTHGFRRVRVLDFGLARPVGDAHLTGNAIVGTPAYMSPEQASGQELDSRTDLFSLGSVLYECLTGQLPFRGANALAVLSALATTVPPPVDEANPEVPTALGELVSRLLSKDVAARPESAAAVVANVEDLLADLNVTTVELPAPKRSRPSRRWRVGVAALFAGALAVLAGVIVVKVKGPDGKETEVTVPEGSKVDVDAKGNVTVQLPPPAAHALAQAPMPRQVDPDELECVLKAGDSYVNGFVVLPDNDTIIGGYSDGFLRVWKISTKRVIREYDTGSYVRCVALHPNARTVGVHTEDGRVFTWDSQTGLVVRTYTHWLLPPHAYSWSMDFAMAGKLLITTNFRSGQVLAWDTGTGSCRVLYEPTKPCSHLFVRTSPDDKEVAVLSSEQPVRILKLPSGEVVSESSAPGVGAAPVFTRDGTGLYFRRWVGHPINLWNRKTGFARTGYLTRQTYGIRSITLSPDEKALAMTDGFSGQVGVWAIDGSPLPVRTFEKPGHTSIVFRLAFTPDGQRLISAHDRGTICVFRVSPEWAKPKPAYPPLDPAWLARVQKLPPEEQFKEVSAELVRRNPGFDGKFPYQRIGETGVDSLSIVTDEVEDISPIRVLTSLKSLRMYGQTNSGKLWDISPLAGIQLNYLRVQSCPLWDLRPLQGMPLKECFLDSTKVFDLSPLSGMKIDHLSLTNAFVLDLSPLKGMPLKTSLYLHNLPNQIDLSPLKGGTLHRICLPSGFTGNLAPLAETPVEHVQVINDAFRFTPEQRKALDGVKTLKTINGKPVAEYWKAIDAEPPKK
jgi:WD40 repeat protein/tRNA A-37 threonylcarbamoyl transferase component Bud32